MILCLICQKPVCADSLTKTYKNFGVSDTLRNVPEDSTENFECPYYEDTAPGLRTCHYYRENIQGGHIEHWIRIMPYRICWIEDLETAEIWLLEDDNWGDRKKITDIPVPKDQLPQLIQRFQKLKVFS